MTERIDVEAGGRLVSVSSPSRVLWPNIGFTKMDAVSYYLRAAPALLAEIAERPLTLKRAPEGVEGRWWYQTECPHPPEWVTTIEVTSAAGERAWNYCSAAEAATLVWLANIGALEIHPLLFTAQDKRHPIELVFDLDPGPPAGLLEAARVALMLRDLLAERGLEALVRSSGATGIHVTVPLDATNTFDDTRAFARTCALELERDDPEVVTTKKGPEARAGKILIDWQQNGPFRSIAAAYSLRVSPLPFVATPLAWDEVERAEADQDASTLLLLPDEVVARIDAGSDPWQGGELRRHVLPL